MKKVALVTGSSRGIGRAIAAHLARSGWAVCINYIQRRDCAEELAAHEANHNNPHVVIQYPSPILLKAKYCVQ